MLNLFRLLSAPCSRNVFPRIVNGSITPKHLSHLSGFHNVRMKNGNGNVSSLFKPVNVQHSDDDNVGAELVGKLDKNEVVKVLNKFTQKPEIKNLCSENGLDGKYIHLV